MSRVLTDQEIAQLVARPKHLPHDWRKRTNLRGHPGDSHKRSEILVRQNGESFIIKCRQSTGNQLDFSVILVYADTTRHEYRLIRCNGKHPSRHTNKWEKLRGEPNHRFGPSFHIHHAPQRYQEEDLEIDGYAEPTSEYSEFGAALDHLIRICNFLEPPPPGGQVDLYGDSG